MKTLHALPRPKRITTGSKPLRRKTGAVIPLVNEEATLPEGPVWGHWFNTEGMLMNNHGALSDSAPQLDVR
jgi:hypothetical protein